MEGKLYDLEVHFVHTVKGSDNIAGSVPQDEIPAAVIGIFFDVEEGGDFENPLITSLTQAIATRSASTKKQVALRDFLYRIDMSEYWSYDGSLTTPPCTEGLKWSVIKQVQPISKAQLKAFTDRLAGDSSFAGGNGNNRVV